MVEATIAGAAGYILKSALADEIIAAIRATAAGEAVLSSKVAGKLLQRIRDSDIPSVTAGAGAAARAIRAVLTEREFEIFFPSRERRQQPDDRAGAGAEHQHRLQPHRQHPQQAAPREPHPSGGPGGQSGHLVSASG